ncbi:MAG: fused MFS/spermidine synthase [Verrucomicrobia bacterium]|nr:fused MFS/spermidine synthase [Verrucomicrobiota bacterium]
MKTTQVIAPAQAPLSAGLRRYLYLTAGLTGAAIMIIEILGAKLLSPYLGTSHFVWTAQIAVTLVALAGGYYAGGLWADRTLAPARLFGAIVAAGVYLAVTVALTETVAYGFLRFSLPVGSLFSSLVLYFVPLGLLAMTCPFLIRLLTVSVSEVGGNAGRLSAVSTLGSFLGTMAIGYMIIPHLPNTLTMYLTAMLLMGLGTVYFAVWWRRGRGLTAVLVATAAGLAAGYAGVDSARYRGQDTVELFRGNSNYGILQVIQDKASPRRLYLNDYLTQNTYDTNTRSSTSMFTYMLHGLARAYTPTLTNVLCIGLGVGIVPMQFAREGVRVDVVEINPAVVPVARDFFGLNPDLMTIILEDGRYYLNRCRQRYDAVIVDAFIGDSCPAHLMTLEAFSAVARILRPQGTLVINTFGNFDPGNDFFTASLWKTLNRVFPGVRMHGSDRGNTLYVASARTGFSLVHEPAFDHVHPACLWEVRRTFDSLREPHPAHGIVLTDNHNPVEFHDAVNRQNHRKYLALAMRQRTESPADK